MFRQKNKNRMRRTLHHMTNGALAYALGLVLIVTAHAASAPAGAKITNQAEASYFNTVLGVTETVESNIVSATVQPVPSLELIGDQIVRTSRSAVGQYNFRIENNGNVTLATTINVSELSDDDFDVNGTLAIDVNENGVIDAGDTPLASGATRMLSPSESLPLIYSYNTPSSVAIGDVSVSEITANAVATVGPSTPLTVNRQSRTIIEDAFLSLQKQASLRAGAGEIDYLIGARNDGQTDVTPFSELEGETLLIDGAARSVVLVRDAIPLNTVFVSATPAGGFDTLYHVRGEPKHTYQSTAPSALSDVDAVAYFHDGPYAANRDADLGFTVSYSQNVETLDIINTAQSYAGSGPEGTPRDSNQVITPISGSGNTIDFLAASGGPSIEDAGFDQNVIVSIGAAACNLTDEIDQIEVTITTETLADVEILPAFETGANTGVFETAPTGTIRATVAVERNGVLEGRPGGSAGASASAACLGETLTTDIGLQPGGFVFDSITDAAVSGAQVFVYNAADFAVAQTTTDAFGYFDLGTIAPGAYRLEVSPPQDYIFPSVKDDFSGFNREVDSEMSYGFDFKFDGGPIANIDIPLDPSVGLPLTMDKTADRSTVRRGGFVIYTLTAQNRMAQALLNAEVEDRLPAGLLYVEGSARLNKEEFETAPSLTRKGVLTFDIGSIEPNDESVVTFAVRAGTAAREGKKVNTAIVKGLQAGTGTAYQSGPGRATVTVDDRGGVFSDEAIVIGRVFLDKNGDGVQNEYDDDDNPLNEPGVPGVKIVTSTGLSAVTDSEGRYSLFGLRPVTHAFALQSNTLPKKTKPMSVEIDDALAPGSRLIDLKRGDLRSEDFPLSWSAVAEADVEARIGRFAGLAKDQSFARDDLPLSFDAARGNSSRNESGLDTTTELLTDAKRSQADTARQEREREEIRADIEEQVKTLDPKLGFVDAEDGDEITRPTMSVRIKGPTKGKIRLQVNGEDVPGSQIGTKVIDSDGGVQVFEYVALRLQPHENTLTAIVSDPFGNDRGREEIKIFAPGKPAALQIVAPKEASANGRSRLPIVIRIVDAEGRLVRVPAEVTLFSENGVWDVPDIRENKFGLQAYIDNGEATFDFIPPDLVGGETLRVESDFADVVAEIGFTPDLTERTFVGVIEGAVSFGEGGQTLEGLMTSHDISSFEETTEGIRGQLYLKGKILGENLLTLRYDSDQDSDERLFRDIRRDEFYPVYGDNSERGFDAQSSTSLYVKVEREQSYILYGDIAIEPQADAIRLGAYRRSLTGGRAHIEEGPVTVDLFVARTDERQRVIELRGRGISGPYDVDFDGITDGSEIVEIITRDRDQRGVILDEERQTRLTDYTVDFFRGALIFNRPIPQLDDNLNPVSIRITYETDEGSGDDYFVYGGEIRVEPVEGIAVGYREVRSNADRGLDERRTVRSAYGEADLNTWGKAQVEFAQTENNLGDKGNGVRASYELLYEGHTIRADAARTDEEFDAPNSSVSPGREELRVRTDHVISDRLSLQTDSLYTRDLETGDRRIGSEITGRYRVDPQLDVIAGGRAVEDHDDLGTEEVYSGIIGAEYRPDYLPGASFHAEYEQDIRENDNWRLTLGGEYQWTPNLRLYALNEISSADTGFFGLGDGAQTNFTTQVGAEYQVTEAITGYSEYRQTGRVGGDGGVANGVRGNWDLTEHLAIRMSAEHVEPIDNIDERTSSVALGAAYENEKLGLIARHDVEADRDERGMGFYTNTAVGYELNNDFTLLFRNRLAVDLRADDRIRDRLRFGIAYRPEHDSRFKSLALYEFEIDDGADLTEQSHRWSLGVTYAPTEDLRTNAKYAGENIDIDGPGFAAQSTLHLGQAGIEYDFGNDEFGHDRFALGGHVALFTDDGGDDVTAGVGIELKANVMENVQLAVGYNHIDIEEDRLRDIYHAGFYARLRIKLDESLWDTFDNAGLTTAPMLSDK